MLSRSKKLEAWLDDQLKYENLNLSLSRVTLSKVMSGNDFEKVELYLKRDQREAQFLNLRTLLSLLGLGATIKGVQSI